MITLAVYLHSLNPMAIRFWGNFGIRWYGLSYVAGFVAGYLILRTMSRRGMTPLRGQLVPDFVLAAAIGTVLGGRLGYVLFYKPELLTQFTDRPPFWGLVAINEGGMASHGAIIGLLLACLYFRRRARVPALHLMDICVQAGTMGVIFGRLANFVNGELIGRPAPAGLPWAVKFPQEMFDWSDAQVDGLADALAPLGMQSTHPHALVERAIAAIQNGNAEVTRVVEPLLTARHPSQLYEAGLEGLFLFLALMAIWWKPRKPGVVAAWFVVLYAVVRIIGEQFRMPDAYIGYQALGLTRGQWLSVAMLTMGFVFMAWVARRPVEKMGGWRVVRVPAVEANAK
jgi:phosphatidylglycerol:prolipoprotein diacylglycerol transferase